MKNVVLIILLFASHNLITARTKPLDSINIKQIAGFCKIWGMLKYYHPMVAKKKVDFDTYMLNKYDDFFTYNDYQSYNSKIIILLNNINQNKNYKKVTKETFNYIVNDKLNRLENFHFLSDTNIYINKISFSWIGDTLFSNDVKYKLAEIIYNYKPLKNKYLKGSKVIKPVENSFENLDSISMPYRMLALFRYWNIINYFFPYKNLSDNNWDTVLINAIPKFLNTKNYQEYVYQLAQLSSKTNDSHCFYNYSTTKYFKNSRPLNKAYGYIPYNFRLIDDNIIISKTLSDSVLLDVGDTVISINDIDLIEYKKRFDATRSFSTIQSEIYNYETNLSNWRDSIFNFSILKNKDTLKISENRTVNKNIKIESRYRTFPFYYLINDNIGYIELTQIKPSQLKKAFKKFHHKENLIFDMRGYPETLAPLLLPHLLLNNSNTVASYSYPYKKYPGIFINNKGVSYNFWFIKPYVLFKKRYKGNVFVLINNEAISYGETVCMIVKACDNHATFIGSSTSGANGNVVSINIPGGMVFNYSSLDWHFPNGTQLQRKGIIPDIIVYPSVEGLKLEKDEILEKTIRVINSN